VITGVKEGGPAPSDSESSVATGERRPVGAGLPSG